MRLNKKQVAQYYIEHAEQAIEKAKLDKWSKNRLLEYLISKELEQGVCNFIFLKYNYDVYDKAYMKKYVPKSSFLNYWYFRPCNFHKRKDIITALQYRINILKTWL